MEKMIPEQLTTLGHAQRLAVFRMLMRRYPDAIPAGELATALNFKASTLSVYLSSLRRARLVRQTRAGTSLLYQADIAAAGALIGYLFEDCCRSRPDLCLPLSPAPTPSSEGMPAMETRKFNVLFICTGNSARSIFAECLLRDEAGDRFEAYSAGTAPRTELNPFAVEMLESKGHNIKSLRAKNVSEFQTDDAPVMDFVFTVCDTAANEDCPAWHGQPVSGHWGQPDPVRAEGTDAEKRLAFQHAYGALRNRIRTFAALPIDTLDRVTLQARVDDIAGMESDT